MTDISMDTCIGCQKVKSLDEHFEAIFDFLDEAGIDYGDLPFIRMDIHNTFNEPHNKGH